MLAEAGAESITSIANTVRPASAEEFTSDVDQLRMLGLVAWGDGAVRDGRYVYFEVPAPSWERLRVEAGYYSWDGLVPLLMLTGDG